MGFLTDSGRARAVMHTGIASPLWTFSTFCYRSKTRRFGESNCYTAFSAVCISICNITQWQTDCNDHALAEFQSPFTSAAAILPGCLKFTVHWNFTMGLLMTDQYWIRQWLGFVTREAIKLSCHDQELWCHEMYLQYVKVVSAIFEGTILG